MKHESKAMDARNNCEDHLNTIPLRIWLRKVLRPQFSTSKKAHVVVVYFWEKCTDDLELVMRRQKTVFAAARSF